MEQALFKLIVYKTTDLRQTIKWKKNEFDEGVFENNSICTLKCKDNKKAVTVLTCFGGSPTGVVKR